MFDLPQGLSSMIVPKTNPVFGDQRVLPWKIDPSVFWKPSQTPRKASDPVTVPPIRLDKQPNRKKIPRKPKPSKVHKSVPMQEPSLMQGCLAQQAQGILPQQPGHPQRLNGSAESCQTSISQPQPEQQTVVSDSVDQDECISVGALEQDATSLRSLDNGMPSPIKDSHPAGGELLQIDPHCPYASDIGKLRPGKQGPVVAQWRDRPGVCCPFQTRREAGCSTIKQLLKHQRIMLGERLWWKQGNVRALAVGWVALDGILCGRCGWVVNIAEFAKCAGVEADSPTSFIHAVGGSSLAELTVMGGEPSRKTRD